MSKEYQAQAFRTLIKRLESRRAQRQSYLNLLEGSSAPMNNQLVLPEDQKKRIFAIIDGTNFMILDVAVNHVPRRFHGNHFPAENGTESSLRFPGPTLCSCSSRQLCAPRPKFVHSTYKTALQS
ncbi:hypothetical protein PHYBLDRAFT_151823 [Phycomyces blakesleeanus NRRL 1555(-)]|uniref:Uncharacterized protein n=1 Tax=Phycomyces blakesleeanus (strain ATCC 8743b / DSM 1359 / FGSC 10004 / NBRC 33097 / NRRL 1555) TaxID=763407 RepID=A0A162WHU7_PHYB8|nr:hypothetical protein PHYBLDRAFT_151823 [Phycomyces blakesleeanus NRRL 1555(-)]OAD67215.1 hypothetical protein PHYBLDRAFT_151823 [Phycomyces blakesleeanus NRRL 1555(-)]|eukprot:XP_018285255.1 hypothetical protein PHYBLDRAFT_151823 [Phycomyces blakesleeanus NRRL 1555(-)]